MGAGVGADVMAVGACGVTAGALICLADAVWIGVSTAGAGGWILAGAVVSAACAGAVVTGVLTGGTAGAVSFAVLAAAVWLATFGVTAGSALGSAVMASGFNLLMESTTSVKEGFPSRSIELR